MRFMFNNMLYQNSLIFESKGAVEGNEDAFLKLGEISIYDENLKSVINVPTEDFVKVVTDAMFMIQNKYKFFYTYIKYSKVFYIPTYPSKIGVNTMAVDDKKNLFMNVHFIYNSCKMDKNKIFGIIFHELMHNFLKHQKRTEIVYPKEYRTKEIHMKCNICQDYEVNSSMVEDNIVDSSFWDKMGGLYDSKYSGKRWEDILRENGDKEYENWLKRTGQALDEKTKKALEAIEKALKVLKDPDSTKGEKDKAKNELKKTIDEIYGKKTRKIVDKADINGLRREIEKLIDSRLADIGEMNGVLQDIFDDLMVHPKDMDDDDIRRTVGDIKKLKEHLMKNIEEICGTFRKMEDEMKDDIKKCIKSLGEALNVLHDGTFSPKDERKIVRKAKDDLEDLILNGVDKKKRAEKREKEIEDYKEKMKKEREEKTAAESKTSKELEKAKKRNPIKRFIDTFKNLRDLFDFGRISEETFDTFNEIIEEFDRLGDMNISIITDDDISTALKIIPRLNKNIKGDLEMLIKERIIKKKDVDVNSFSDDVFDALSKFLKVVIDEDEPASVKYGAMSNAVMELRKLGKLLKTKRKIRASEKYKKAYAETRNKLVKIYKEKGVEALIDEIKKLRSEYEK